MSNNRRYERIRNILSSLVCTNDKLDELKNVYADKINSKRRLAGVRSIKDLLQILEKRDHINPEKIDALIGLAACFEGIPIELFLAENAVNNDQNNDGFKPIYYPHNPVLPRLSTDLRERVYEVIASDIGQKWTDLARALHVPEGHIDDLFYGERNGHNRVYEILRYHQERCDTRFWRSALLEGLAKARRNDLKRRVQNIFDTYLP